MIGRPTRLTPEVADAIVAAVRQGAPLGVSAQSVGIAPMTFWEWMVRGEGRHDRPQTSLYAEFAERIREAEAEVHLRYVKVITDEIETGNANVAMRWIKLRWAKQYAEHIEVSAAEEWRPPTWLTQMSDAELEAAAERLQAQVEETA